MSESPHPVHRLLSDPFVAAEVEAAIAPFLGALDEDDLTWMRRQLAQLLEEDPRARATLLAAHPRGAETSGEVLQIFAADVDVPGKVGHGGGRGP